MPNFQTIAALLIVAGAAFFLVRRIHKGLKKSDSSSCGCGCSGCNASDDCEETQPREAS
jgi:hypothetical protein